MNVSLLGVEYWVTRQWEWVLICSIHNTLSVM
uniref:Uncharacterized protein n=1 Tax=Anguilla anguilla TaxID=7936 RepID=A0A0E9QTZ9_ANGAN